ncbi:PQQ-dependent sugar dehydrogenase [Mesonia ostreae]|uniref:PQQ-dependent sugar dehydrogenase n=1 Tax=Mesonia ostreae TaxID=861110 RepID=A0ABU2KEE5_9FLAO|nr:PQQ-dependent sugar dehydrogenase [Mesonia ostreae]MDT0293074.1 PQQ-dependent sugar dehydrogenase [Mesonia ostreae]
MKKIQSLFIPALLICFVACGQIQKAENEKKVQTPSTTYTYEVIVDDLQNPWGFVFLPDKSMLITEKKGDLLLVKNNKKTRIKNVPQVYEKGQGGLLDIALHPNYSDNGWIYITYASAEGNTEGGNTAMMRAKLENASLVQKELLYKATPNTTRGQHFGSRIVFDKENHVYFSIGERGNRDENPQDLTRDGGKIYRLNDDGSIPKSNPFYTSAEAKKAIFSYGHRNPQGMEVHPQTKEIWLHEHGPKGGDEINIVKKGANYGWPIVTYGKNYSGTSITDKTSAPGMTQPIHYWVPSIAPSGMAFVTSNKYPKLKGGLLVGSLKFQYLEFLALEGEKVTKRIKLLEDVGRVRSIHQADDGFIYIGVENLGIVKLISKKR